MTVVIVVSDCPPRLRGDLTKWLLEVNTGVYVGNLNARVRDRLWERVCENLKSGRATMVFRAAGEQHLDFRVHNTTWEPVDYDGIKLIRRPIHRQISDKNNETLSVPLYKAEKQRMARRMPGRRAAPLPSDYCVLDLETTGLDCEKDTILEIGALRVRDDSVVKEFQTVVFSETPVQETVEKMTGLSPVEIAQKGMPLKQALEELTNFVGEDSLVCHNAPFVG